MKGAKLSGKVTFYPLGYLRNTRDGLIQSANPEGSGQCLVAAALMAAFTVEALLNHLGCEAFGDWKETEKKDGWETKLTKLASHFEIPTDWGSRPLQTVKELFAFRDRLAHGKIEEFTSSYASHGQPEDSAGAMVPKWLKEYESTEKLAQAIESVNQVIQMFVERKALGGNAVALIGEGKFEEVRRSDKGR